MPSASAPHLPPPTPSSSSTWRVVLHRSTRPSLRGLLTLTPSLLTFRASERAHADVLPVLSLPAPAVSQSRPRRLRVGSLRLVFDSAAARDEAAAALAAAVAAAQTRRLLGSLLRDTGGLRFRRRREGGGEAARGRGKGPPQVRERAAGGKERHVMEDTDGEFEEASETSSTEGGRSESTFAASSCSASSSSSVVVLSKGRAACENGRRSESNDLRTALPPDRSLPNLLPTPDTAVPQALNPCATASLGEVRLGGSARAAEIWRRQQRFHRLTKLSAPTRELSPSPLASPDVAEPTFEEENVTSSESNNTSEEVDDAESMFLWRGFRAACAAVASACKVCTQLLSEGRVGVNIHVLGAFLALGTCCLLVLAIRVSWNLSRTLGYMRLSLEYQEPLLSIAYSPFH